MREYKELTNDDRYVIYKLLNKQIDKRKIADIIGCHISTIYREIKRGLVEQLTTQYEVIIKYDPYTANERSKRNKSKRGANLKLILGCEYLEFIKNKIINDKFSPRAIVMYLKNKTNAITFDKTLCDKSIYRYIKLGLIDGVNKTKLHYKIVKNKYIKRIRKRTASGKSIEKRPKEILARKELGHWEMDSVVGKQGNSKKTLLVLTERFTRYEKIFLLDNHSTAQVVSKINFLEKELKRMFSKIFKTITVDNGIEFSDNDGIEKSLFHKNRNRVDLYFCHPFSSCERGTNENTNKLIRYFIPKGTNFDNKTDKDIEQIKKWINEYPRKLFDGANAKSRFVSELKKLNIDYNTISNIL